jgi:phage terminase large subunit-like protein
LPFKQTAMQFNFPLKFLEKQIYDNNIALGQNPVLRWNFRNVVLYVDGNGNIKIVKNKSLDSVDGVVSLAMAMGGWIAENLDAEGMNLDVYLNY